MLTAVGAILGLLFLSNTYLLFNPVAWVDPPLAVRVGLFYAAAVWNFGSLLSAALLLGAQAGGLAGRAILALWRMARARPTAVPVDPGRRRLLKAGVGGLAAAPIVFSGYGAAYAARGFAVEELDLPFGHALRVVQVTDIHAGIYITRREVRRIADQVSALQPDLFVLTGDYITNSMVFLPGCLEEMARVRARYGTFATLGNHENWYGTLEELQTAFRRHGIPLLVNAHHVVQTERGRFAVAGVDDLRSGDPDLEAALRGLDPSLPTLLLSHRPEIFPDAAGRGVALTLSGHYHGGQVALKLPAGPVSFAHLRTPYPEGLFRIDHAHLYVSRGIGTTFTPVRLNAPAEITLLRLR